MKKNITKELIVAALAVACMCQVSHGQSPIGLNFDGIDDRCTINDNAAYNLGTGNFTVEAWIKASTPQNNSSPSIFSRRSGNGLSIYLNSIGQLGVNLSGANAIFGSADMDDNICHHIAVVRSSLTAVSIYVDGVLKGTTSGFSYGTISTNVGITIGYGGAFKGWIHEVRFWNVARTQTQIAASKNVFLAGNETGLIGYWRMNEGSGQTINDLSATNNDGFLGTINTTDAADPVFTSNSCMCPNPVITTTGGAVCSGQTPTLSTALITGYTYQWRLGGNNIAGATNSSFIATASGNYQCQATAFGCSGLSNTISLISGAPTAVITAGGPTTFCMPNSVGLGANAGTMLGYQWKLNGNNINGAWESGYTAYSGGTYTCVVTNNCGSSTSNPISVTVNQAPAATITPGGPLNFCIGGSVTLTANPGAGYTYQWKKNSVAISGATSQNYVASQGGSYTVTVTSGSCNATSGATSVIVEQALSPTISSNYLWFCQSTTVGLDVGPTGGTATYQWFEDTHLLTGATNFELVTGHNGNYTCAVTNLCGTYNTPIFVLNDWLLTMATKGTINPSGSYSVCKGAIIPIWVDEYSMFLNFQWLKNGVEIPGANGSGYDATQTGSYACRMTDYDCNQTYFSNWFTLTVNPLPSVVITPAGPTTFCSGGSVTLQAAIDANRSYQWKKGNVDIAGATSSSYLATVGGSYKVTVTNTATGCSKTTGTSTIVTVNSNPAANITPQGPTTFCAGGSVVLKGNTGTGLTYQWKKGGNDIAGATAKDYTAIVGGVYKVKVTNSNGCTKLSSGVTVTVPCKLNESEVENENMFNVIVYPNPSSGDFIFEFENAETENISLSIYDMVGKLVESDVIVNPQFTINGSQFQPGVYMAEIICGKHKKVIKLVKTY